MLHRTKLHQILKRLGHAIFHVSWIKKDGSERTANARCKVRKGIKGTGRRVNQTHNANISIYLMGNEKEQPNPLSFEMEYSTINNHSHYFLELEDLTTIYQHNSYCLEEYQF